MPAIILTNEGVERISVPLRRATLLIGSDPNSEIHLDNADISRNHASIIYDNDRYVIHDNGSTNGTFVNGELITKRTLAHHDHITFGPYQFRVDLAGDGAGQESSTQRPVYLNSNRAGQRSSVDLQHVNGLEKTSSVRVLSAGEIPARRKVGEPSEKKSSRLIVFAAWAAFLAISAIAYIGIAQRHERHEVAVSSDNYKWIPTTIKNDLWRQLKIDRHFQGKNRCFSRREPRREAEPTEG